MRLRRRVEEFARLVRRATRPLLVSSPELFSERLARALALVLALERLGLHLGAEALRQCDGGGGFATLSLLGGAKPLGVFVELLLLAREIERRRR